MPDMKPTIGEATPPGWEWDVQKLTFVDKQTREPKEYELCHHYYIKGFCEQGCK